MGNHVHAQKPINFRKKKGTDIGSGKPGQARVKAMEKREKTLLVEYLAKNKDNVVRDRRIGVRSGDQVCVLFFVREKFKEVPCHCIC